MHIVSSFHTLSAILALRVLLINSDSKDSSGVEHGYRAAPVPSYFVTITNTNSPGGERTLFIFYLWKVCREKQSSATL